MALRRSSTTRDFLSTLGGFGCPRGAGAVLTTSLADTRRVRAPRLPFTKAPLGPEGDLDGLFAVGGHRGATVGNLGGMNDPELDLEVRLAVSRPAHLGIFAVVIT